MNRIESIVSAWLRCGARDNPAPSSTRVPVLLASNEEGDGSVLQSLLHGTRWSMALALSWADVSGFGARVVKPIVIVDRHFQGSDWRFTVSSLLNSRADCS